MEARGKTSSNGGETSMSEKKTENGSEVVVEIRTESGSAKKGSESPFPKQLTKTDSPQKVSTESTGISKSVPVICPSPEIGRFSPSPNKPPKIPATNDTLTRRKSLNRSSVFSRPKSRFGEPSVSIDPAIFEEHNGTDQNGLGSPHRGSFNKASPNNDSIAQKSAAEDEDDEIYKKVVLSEEKRKRVKAKVVVEWIMFLFLVGCLTASLTVERLERTLLWELELWKWVVLVMGIICGMLVTNWFMRIVVFVIERNFLLRKKVLYFVHGLKKSVQVFIWLCLVLLTWVLVFNYGIKRSKTANKILDYVTWTLVTLLIGGFLWLIKTLLLKILASNFHVNTFFDRIQESIFHQYVLQTFSGPALIEEAEQVGRSPSMGQLSFRSSKKGKAAKTKETIDMAKLHKMKQGKVSAWTMKVLVDAVSRSGLSTVSNTLDEMENGAMEQTDKEITNEVEATAAAYHIFRNVAPPGSKFIDEDDLLRFMIKEEVDIVLLLFGTDNGRIDRKALTDWVIKVYNVRKALAHALNDTKTAVKQLNKLVIGILFVVTIVVWLLLTEIATTKVLLFLSSQLVVAAFMFGNTCKTIFEAIVFVFVMHPFDVGDRCVVDGVPLLVEEMNILTTVFLKLNNEKVYYPNSVLSTKPISNYYRSSDMGDTVEFSIDFMTPVEKIGHLKDKINQYIEKNPLQWHPNHSVMVVEIEDVNKLDMVLYVNHTISFQEYGEKDKRRTELVMEIKRIFEEVDIKYYLLPQAIELGQSVLDTIPIKR
ncbi:Mechanosensitive ion channel protein 10 [Morus notabilis]|uniref:Mechanosensitive ion channel protein n=1 Tax=Morus notabilis TaxID=981085 RepID=W9RHJ3_9ROSA|nr:mechanosensitive ion channel protein 10 [Morus notabilis]EXB74867.1 Mechanosensitive ion channel protein 10 [Morus notabilis]